MKRIAVVTGTRAEYGLLKPVLRRIRDDRDLELILIVTGAHLEPRFGETINEIERDGFSISYKIPMELSSDSEESVVSSMGLELIGFSKILNDAHIDLMCLLGDRYEILMAAVAALIFRIPVAHIHGGELTRGLVDDAIRHSVTKISSLHFTSTEEYRRRVIQMGEMPSTVFCVGALGVENIKNITRLTKKELTDKYGITFEKPIVMVTFHPVTLEDNSAEAQISTLLSVLSMRPDYNYIFTYANADPDGQIINIRIEEFVRKNKNAIAFSSMGLTGYLSTLAYASAVVGNSSSGILEAPSFGIPTVNIGDRQGGRIHAESVIDCAPDKKSIERAVDKAFSKKFLEKCRHVENPYDKSGTSENIVNHIKDYLSREHTTKKDFYDIPIGKEVIS